MTRAATIVVTPANMRSFIKASQMNRSSGTYARVPTGLSFQPQVYRDAAERLLRGVEVFALRAAHVEAAVVAQNLHRSGIRNRKNRFRSELTVSTELNASNGCGALSWFA